MVQGCVRHEVRRQDDRRDFQKKPYCAAGCFNPPGIACEALFSRCLGSEIPEGASLELLSDVGFAGSRFYLYTPSRPHLNSIMSPMRNCVLFVYPEKPYGSREAVREVLEKTGLLDLAEKEAIYVVLPFPVAGGTWSAADLKLYYESQYYLAGGDVYDFPSMQYERVVFNNLQYVIAEGRGATFVNNILSQHAQRIAGILTFGGDMAPTVKRGPALPAYLVNAHETAVGYYKAVNEVDTEVLPGVFENSRDGLKKVVVAGGGNGFDAPAVADAWRQLFSRTARVCITDNVVMDNKVSSAWILMARPSYRELGITRGDHEKETLPGGLVATWYDFVPDRVMVSPEIRVPLVITLHGMDGDPVYEAESNGWVAKAAAAGFIVVSPEHAGPTTAGEKTVLAVLEYAKNAYPIDESRVYLAGYSMGGAATAMIGLRNADTFAAIAPMGAAGYCDDALAAMVASAKAHTDMPFVSIIGTADDLSVTRDDAGVRVDGGIGIFKGGLKLLLEINSLGEGKPDYIAHPYWGYPTCHPEVRSSRGLKYHVSYMRKEGADMPIAKFVLLENAGHCHADDYATLAWEFFSMFSGASSPSGGNGPV